MPGMACRGAHRTPRFTSLTGARSDSRDILEINSDDSAVRFLSTAPRRPRCFLPFLQPPRANTSRLLVAAEERFAATRDKLLASPLRHRLDIPTFLPRRNISREIIYARAEMRVIISRDKSVGRGNYQPPYSRSQNPRSSLI